MVARVLWGSDHVEYGDIVVDGPVEDVAVALTRGRRPKPYRWLDPNEDVVAAVAGPRATLLAVADGHNGAVAPEVAIRTVLAQLGNDPPPDLDDAALVDLFDEITKDILAATEALSDERRDSRTTLSVALVGGRRVRWASMGDSPVLAVDGRRGRALSKDTAHYVGWPMTRDQLDRAVQRGRARLGSRAWVVVVSDGFSNFTTASSPVAAATAVLAGATDARSAARGLIEHAFAGGAGDNVAAAVAAPR